MAWRSFVRMTLFFLAFTLNVTVKAEVLQEPKTCHNNTVIPCAYFIQDHQEMIGWDQHTVRLSKATSFIKKAEGEYALVSGEALVQTEEPIQVSSIYGHIHLEKGLALIKVDNKKMSFYSLNGVLQYQPRGDKSKTFLPVGFNNFISRVKDNGIADSGYPKPAELDELLPLWASFFNQSEKDILQSQMTLFREPWRVAVESSGPWYVDTIKRQIAALQAERDRKKRLREARLKEQNYFKEMFRRRNNL